LPSAAILLVNPGPALVTRDVFAAFAGRFSQAKPLGRPWRNLSDFVHALASRGNDLTAPAVLLSPVIADVLTFLLGTAGARYAAMSGSGATCFALYDSLDAARRAAAVAPPAWWRHAGTFVS
jgi:4-diphosphocytidyl-2-C-methyl-D-erythritol kinase